MQHPARGIGDQGLDLVAAEVGDPAPRVLVASGRVGPARGGEHCDRALHLSGRRRRWGGPGLRPLVSPWCHLQPLQLLLPLSLLLRWHGPVLQLSQLSQGRHRERRALRRVAIARHRAGRVAQG